MQILILIITKTLEIVLSTGVLLTNTLPRSLFCLVLFLSWPLFCFVLFSFNNLFLIMCRNNLRRGRTKLSKHLITKDPWLQMHDKYSVKFCIVCYIY